MGSVASAARPGTCTRGHPGYLHSNLGPGRATTAVKENQNFRWLSSSELGERSWPGGGPRRHAEIMWVRFRLFSRGEISAAFRIQLFSGCNMNHTSSMIVPLHFFLAPTSPSQRPMSRASTILWGTEAAGITHLFVNLDPDHHACLAVFVPRTRASKLQISTCPIEINAFSAASSSAKVLGRPAAVLVYVDYRTQALTAAASCRCFYWPV